MLSYFVYYMDAQFKEQWSSLYYSTFVFKFLLTVVLAYVTPAHFQRDEKVE